MSFDVHTTRRSKICKILVEAHTFFCRLITIQTTLPSRQSQHLPYLYLNPSSFCVTVQPAGAKGRGAVGQIGRHKKLLVIFPVYDTYQHIFKLKAKITLKKTINS
jgi:hypothetical protein